MNKYLKSLLIKGISVFWGARAVSLASGNSVRFSKFWDNNWVRVQIMFSNHSALFDFYSELSPNIVSLIAAVQGSGKGMVTTAAKRLGGGSSPINRVVAPVSVIK